MPKVPGIYSLCEKWQEQQAELATELEAVTAKHEPLIAAALDAIKAHPNYAQVSPLFEAPQAAPTAEKGGDLVYAQCRPDGTVFNKTTRLVTTVAQSMAPVLKLEPGDALDGYFVKVVATDEVVATELTWRKAREASA